MNQKMPKNKAQLRDIIENAFKAGCNWGYYVDHSQNVSDQEDIGFLEYIGEISNDKAHEMMYKIFNEIDGFI